MTIYGDSENLFTLKFDLGSNLRELDEIINNITALKLKMDNTSINIQEFSEDIQRLYEKELSLKSELKAILIELSKIICIGLQEKETEPAIASNWGLNSSFIVRRKPNGEF